MRKIESEVILTCLCSTKKKILLHDTRKTVKRQDRIDYRWESILWYTTCECFFLNQEINLVIFLFPIVFNFSNELLHCLMEDVSTQLTPTLRACTLTGMYHGASEGELSPKYTICRAGGRGEGKARAMQPMGSPAPECWGQHSFKQEMLPNATTSYVCPFYKGSRYGK